MLLNAYTVKWKRSADTQELLVWERFSDTLENAKDSASKAIDFETSGRGVILSVEPRQHWPYAGSLEEYSKVTP